MAYDAHKNFAYSTVAVAPSPASSGTSMEVPSGHGTRYPTPPFNGSVWPIGTVPTPVNAELVRVTAIVGDVLTIVRAQEGSSARSIIVGDQFAAAISAKTLTDIESVPIIHDTATTSTPSSPTNNFALDANASVLRWTGTVSPVCFTGFTGGVDGRQLLIQNRAASVNLTLKLEADSTGSNRIVSDLDPGPTQNHVFPPGSNIRVMYDGVASRWRVLSATTGSMVPYQTALVGTQNDMVVPNAFGFGQTRILRCNNASLLTITGITGLENGGSGKVFPWGTSLIIRSVGAGNVSIDHQAGGSISTARIITTTGGTVTLTAGSGQAYLYYDNSEFRWVMLTI
jgi:hypothetical protein